MKIFLVKCVLFSLMFLIFMNLSSIGNNHMTVVNEAILLKDRNFWVKEENKTLCEYIEQLENENKNLKATLKENNIPFISAPKIAKAFINSPFSSNMMEEDSCVKNTNIKKISY